MSGIFGMWVIMTVLVINMIIKIEKVVNKWLKEFWLLVAYQQ